ncbi:MULTISPECIES: phosphoribosylformylglycinamidine synthase subunit PurS [Acidiplasma]|jgi:phosphoribosylformylglycinamidine synthase|uniref:Phosphoribosylformylglycinamidine synthase subunit PurS n=2 Tax=Acidiplasma TaxID=507753 RepID=A0A0Q0RPV2_9ARCH|nr:MULTISPECIES: phosphoribosylformylglycinamidine synthase subunit PurS [Acidiplasma]KJE48740.1 phosphoribosylformylglycinamidine synthase [Acidiplasma sp. MBA-1]KPV46335.1 phosphoribosylformylglycinamidine synthase [Acidiplasma aeolicum]KQB34186.1 phosphoribosylformylglycinamidine synthase [Acidiplasma cupricumulans]KQB34625.1 phosphoribosylformylglycinamidine synthase [Acidiplasma aeolicum]WMT55592.1 MAG: phosphoribosylformylglycinamidine synthase subunit PurS [Acidiplasma sp.]
MKIRVEIKYLPNVEDPEALSIKRNLSMLGYSGIDDVKTYKIYEFTTSINEEDSMRQIQDISENILTNPVIQEYKIEKISD